MENTNEDTNKDQNTNTGLAIVKNLMTVPTKETVNRIREVIESGDVDTAYMAVVIKKFAKIAEVIKEKNKDLQEIMNDAVKAYQIGTAKTFNVYGAKVTLANRGYWDYSRTQDPVLEKMLEIQADLKIQIKARQDELQAKALAWETKNSPKNIIDFGLKSFNITWDELPELKWIEGAGEVETNPPIKKGIEQLRYSL